MEGLRRLLLFVSVVRTVIASLRETSKDFEAQIRNQKFLKFSESYDDSLQRIIK